MSWRGKPGSHSKRCARGQPVEVLAPVSHSQAMESRETFSTRHGDQHGSAGFQLVATGFGYSIRLGKRSQYDARKSCLPATIESAGSSSVRWWWA